MAKQTVLSMKDRLKQIVNLSYEILCNKISCGGVQIPNEASLQMQFGVILKQVGQLFEFEKNEHFLIDLETPQEVSLSPKSGSTHARCDISLKMVKGKKEVCAAIEIKHFRKDKNETVTDNRFSVMLDLKNLELYKEQDKNLLCYEIVYTNNVNYTLPGRSKIELSGNISGNIIYTDNKQVDLSNSYNADWDCYEKENNYFLKIEF